MVTELECGTEFYINNGNWAGCIVRGKDNRKYIHCLSTDVPDWLYDPVQFNENSYQIFNMHSSLYAEYMASKHYGYVTDGMLWSKKMTDDLIFELKIMHSYKDGQCILWFQINPDFRIMSRCFQIDEIYEIENGLMEYVQKMVAK